ncbi:MAG: protein kinase [Vicinamibacteria bacterium]
MIGRTLAHYHVVEKLGEGGMGVLYRARDPRLERDVALKVLRPRDASAPGRRDRLLREAKAASALNHPHIVTVYDVGSAPVDGRDVDFIAMECLPGQSLDQVLLQRRLAVGEVLDYGCQIAEALAVAHGAAIVHRDVKPANVMVGEGGHVKVLDFGLARQIEREPAHVEGPTASASGTPPEDDTGPRPAGTAAYMSPEQADGQLVDARSDVFSLGTLLYEMLTGRRPFAGDTPLSLATSILRDPPPPLRGLRKEVPKDLERVVVRCLEKERSERYASAAEVLLELVACRARARARASGWRGAWRRPRIVAPAALAVVALLLLAGAFWRREVPRRWALAEALPEIDRLVAANETYRAYWLARSAERALPGDQRLARFWQERSFVASLRTDPPGAEVFVKSYRTPAEEWTSIGRTPLDDYALPADMLRLRIEKAGFEQVDATFAPGRLSRSLTYRLDALGTIPPGMVRVPGGRFAFRDHPPVELDDFWLDRHEVTNRAFKEFVDRGGYAQPSHWRHPFVRDGRSLAWAQAMSAFRDRTGRPGPATWELGSYPDGQAEYPVGGLSWFEAAAYAQFAGKDLPTFHHWYKATDLGRIFNFADIVDFSNFGGQGPVPVGSLGGTSPYGSLDMAGNVREWTATHGGDERYALGGAWDEPAHSYIYGERVSPWSRLPVNGFRCARYPTSLGRSLTAPIESSWRNYAQETPVSDEAFASYRSFFAYDRTELESVVESVEETEHWRREVVSFAAAYGGERVRAHLFLPRGTRPPYQTVVFHPTGAAFVHTSSDRIQTSHFDYVVRSGRAVLHPVYKGTYERRLESWLDGPNAYRDLVIQQVKDLGRAVDYLQTRPDVDRARLGVFGISGNFELYALALDDRLKVGVVHAGGLESAHVPAEIDPLNFAPRVREPFLLLNGRYDSGYPVEILQKPLVRLLGTPAKDKRHVLVDSGHSVARSLERMRETVDWLDRYLGPVERAAPVASSR